MCSWRKTSAKRRRPSWPSRSRNAGSVGEQTQPVGKLGDVAGRNQKAGFVGNDHFPGPVHVVTDRRLAGDQRLGQHTGKALAKTGMDHNVHRRDQFRDALGRNKAGKLKIVGQPGVGDLLLQPLAKDAVADKEETDVGGWERLEALLSQLAQARSFYGSVRYWGGWKRVAMQAGSLPLLVAAITLAPRITSSWPLSLNSRAILPITTCSGR